MTTTDLHISRSWGVDSFAPDCGCKLLPCGHVSAARASRNCDQHSPDGLSGKTIRSMHTADNCPESEGQDD